MLVYHPAYDSYHCITRIIKILTTLETKEYNIDRIKIYDYFLLFINDIQKITLPLSLFKYKNLVNSNKYNQIEDSKYVFNQLDHAQIVAFRAMASFGFIDKFLYEKEIISFGEIPIPNGLVSNITGAEAEYFSLVKDYFEKLSLRELKQRTKIMDYRYELSKDK